MLFRLHPNHSVGTSLAQIVLNFHSVQPRVVEAPIYFSLKISRRSEAMEESNCLERNVDRWSVLLEEAKGRRFKIQIKINKLQKLKRAEDDKIARIEKNIRENQIKLHNRVSHLM